jgi:hypothetical protein
MLGLSLGLLVGCAQLPFGFGAYSPAGSPPRFVATDFVDLAAITSISKFRSGAGHDYSDGFETQRSMKHYYLPFDASGGDNETIVVRSPVAGTLTMAWDEGTRSNQIRIVPSDYPYLTIVIFHVATDLAPGVQLAEGEQIGFADVTGGAGQATADFDIAVWSSDGRLISWFDIMSDALFASTYVPRGVADRDALIISKDFRDANPVDFGQSTAADWLPLL